MGHGRVVRTLDTVMGGGVAADFGARWVRYCHPAHSAHISIYRANARRHVLMPPSCRNDKILHVNLQDYGLTKKCLLWVFDEKFGDKMGENYLVIKRFEYALKLASVLDGQRPLSQDHLISGVSSWAHCFKALQKIVSFKSLQLTWLSNADEIGIITRFDPLTHNTLSKVWSVNKVLSMGD